MHSPILLFQSSRFEVLPGEDELTNPGVYGRQLATWLAAELPTQGYEAAGEVLPEDFGWVVPVAEEDCSLYVACANAEKGWQVYVFAEISLMSRMFGQDPRPVAVTTLFSAIRDILAQTQDITDLHEDT